MNEAFFNILNHNVVKFYGRLNGGNLIKIIYYCKYLIFQDRKISKRMNEVFFMTTKNQK